MTRNLIVPVFLLALSGAAFGDAGDPPARVARLNYVTGSVSFRPGSVEDWAEATLNYPMTTGDHLWADENSSAEMHVGSTSMRLSAQTAVEFINLDDRVAQFSVRQGGLNIRLRNLEDGETFEIDTPNGAVSLLGAGDYRVDVNPDDNYTYVTVRGGEAEVNGAGNPFRVRAGEFAHLSGDPAVSEIAPARSPDGWDQWCMDRDRSEDQAAAVSARYVPREMVGTEDLGANGVWREEAEYGVVWAPRVAPGWAPYHYGHWAWVEPWGWTWIDDAPWGFAPFHYGRWAYAGAGWVWVPGAVVARPVYAPALVVFVGVGPGVGWFPLGPREVYVPAYRVNRIAVANVRYVNQTVPGALIAVPQRTFAGAQPVGRASIAISREQIARAEVVHVAPVAPDRQAVLGRAGSGRVVQPPSRIEGRTVFARTTPPPAQVPFATRQRALEANPGRPLDQGTLNNLRTNAPAGNPRVRQVGQAGGSMPAPRRMDSSVDRPNPVRPGLDRPINAGRPAPNVEQPRNVERPANVERSAPPEVRREATPERRQERKAETPERSQKRDERRKEDKKKEEK